MVNSIQRQRQTKYALTSTVEGEEGSTSKRDVCPIFGEGKYVNINVYPNYFCDWLENNQVDEKFYSKQVLLVTEC
jgi:hypothetical protein